jgi:hypothetical protein
MKASSIKPLLDTAAIVFSIWAVVAACVWALLSGCSGVDSHRSAEQVEPCSSTGNDSGSSDRCDYRTAGGEFTAPPDQCLELRYDDCVGKVDCRGIPSGTTIEVQWVGYGAAVNIVERDCSEVCL